MIALGNKTENFCDNKNIHYVMLKKWHMTTFHTTQHQVWCSVSERLVHLCIGWIEKKEKHFSAKRYAHMIWQ